jgi:hypothetical protein
MRLAGLAVIVVASCIPGAVVVAAGDGGEPKPDATTRDASVDHEGGFDALDHDAVEVEECTHCGTSEAGRLCIDGGGCGCKQAADCPPFMACNAMSQACTAQCGIGEMMLCNGGCCDLRADGGPTCTHGGIAEHCGSDGGVCFYCEAGTPGGPRCDPATAEEPEHCGCYVIQPTTETPDEVCARACTERGVTCSSKDAAVCSSQVEAGICSGCCYGP